MIRLSNLTDEEIKAIGRRIGEAFYDEGEGVFTQLAREDAVRVLEIMTECYYRLGVLYTTSEQQEGYLAYSREATSQVDALARIFGDCREGPIPLGIGRAKGRSEEMGHENAASVPPYGMAVPAGDSH